MPATTQLVYRLRMQTGSEAERFSVDVVPPLFRTRLGSGDNVRREGATITPDASGRARRARHADADGARAGRSSPARRARGLAAHGYEPATRRFVVELPANSVSTLVARYRTGEFALWPGSDLRLTMRAGRETTGYGAATLDREVEVRSPSVALSGRTAPRVELWTSPQSSPGVYHEAAPARGRQPPVDRRPRRARPRRAPGIAVAAAPRRGRGGAPPGDRLDRPAGPPALPHAHAGARRQLRALGAHARTTPAAAPSTAARWPSRSGSPGSRAPRRRPVAAGRLVIRACGVYADPAGIAPTEGEMCRRPMARSDAR